MGRSKGIGRRHKRGTGNNRKLSSKRVITKKHYISPLCTNPTIPAASSVPKSSRSICVSFEQSSSVPVPQNILTPFASRSSNTKNCNNTPSLGSLSSLSVSSTSTNDCNLLNLSSSKQSAKSNVNNHLKNNSKSSVKKNVTNVVQLISNSSNSTEQVSKILKGVLNHPKLSDVAKQIGYNSSSVATSNFCQSSRLLAATSNGGIPTQKRKRVTSNQQAFIASAAVAVVETPPTSPETETNNDNQSTNNKKKDRTKIKIKDKFKSIGLDQVKSESQCYRIMHAAGITRKKIINNSKDAWVMKKNKSGYSKISPDLCDKVVEWIKKHPHVVHSPISNDKVYVKNPTTGEKEKVTKLLLECSVRELHNDLISPPPTGLKEAVGSNGETIISDTRLRSLLPDNL